MSEKSSALLQLIDRTETPSIHRSEDSLQPTVEASAVRDGYTPTEEVFSKSDGIDSPANGIQGETYRQRFDRLFGDGNWDIHEESPVVMRVIVISRARHSGGLDDHETAEKTGYTPKHARELGDEALRHAA